MKLIRRVGANARRRRTLGSTAVAGAAALSLVALAACGSSNGKATSADSNASGTPVSGGTLNVSFFQDNASLLCVDPFQTYWIEHRTVIRNVADSLTDQDPETGEIEPWLATAWSVNDAGTEYTFD
ncbi:MAG: extracellular solute-binding protein family 5, partial [Frankiales bacterium]|nr:extracellular solute-binding protein family 5 [Frankiales bacterium]